MNVGPASKLAFTQQPGDSTGGVAFATQPTVAVQDLAGNTVTTDTSPVTLALTVPGGATLSCTSNPVAAVTGVASFAGCRVNVAGSYHPHRDRRRPHRGGQLLVHDRRAHHAARARHG